MKKFAKALLFISTALILAGCGSAPKAQNDEVTIQEAAEKVKKEPKPITVQNTSNQKEKEFKNLLSKLELKVTSAPSAKKTVYSGNQFPAPYVVTASTEAGPETGLDISVSYPVSRNNDIISYNTIQLKTDENGQISFLPPASQIAVKDKITFYPTPVSSNSSVVQEAYNAGVTAPFTVKSKYTQWPGGIIFVYDFNENGKAGTNDFELLQDLRNSGINAGNAPVSDTKYLDKPVSELYKACHDIVGNNAAFLISGSFKYASAPVEEAGSATVTLTADLTCIDMKTGSELYKTSITETVTDTNKWNATKKCRGIIAEKASDAIIYGM